MIISLTTYSHGDGVAQTATLSVLLIWCSFGPAFLNDYARRHQVSTHQIWPSVKGIITMAPNIALNMVNAIIHSMYFQGTNATKALLVAYICHSLATTLLLIYLCNLIVTWAIALVKRETLDLENSRYKKRIHAILMFQTIMNIFVVLVVVVSLVLYVDAWIHNYEPGLPTDLNNQARYFVHATIFFPYILFGFIFGIFGIRYTWYNTTQLQLAPNTPKDIDIASADEQRAINILAIVAMFCFMARGVLSLVIVVSNSGDLLLAVENGYLSNVVLNIVPSICILATHHYSAIHRIHLLRLSRRLVNAGDSMLNYGSMAKRSLLLDSYPSAPKSSFNSNDNDNNINDDDIEEEGSFQEL